MQGSDLIKTVRKARVGMLFPTRFAPETKIDDVRKMVEQNEFNNHVLLKVEKLPTKQLLQVLQIMLLSSRSTFIAIPKGNGETKSIGSRCICKTIQIITAK